nr:unnamed protein product [Callosobruchus chinensis]
MSGKHYCLKWTKFEANILNAFESLQATEDLTDVTLACDGISIKAHKFILSACSPYFRAMFKENPCSHPIVILNNISQGDLMAIINFMYHGEVTVSEEQLATFLQTAVVLQVSGLMNNDQNANKRLSNYPKKSKPTNAAHDYPNKKPKTAPKTKVTVEELPKETNQFEMVEMSKIKTEDETNDSNDFNVIDKVEVVVGDKPETQGSILEAALEVKDKPSSILKRSLTAQAVKSPSCIPYPVDKICVIPDIPKTAFSPQKSPEKDAEKCGNKSSESSPTAFDYSITEYLQQRTKTEEHLEGVEHYVQGMLPEDVTVARTSLDIQPHHSSQCGTCPHCGKVYSNQSALKYHVRLVHSDLTNMYCCHLCPEAFDYREGYKRHMAEAHMIRN